MKNKNFLYECNCKHCQQKIDQIKNSKLYWEKLILEKSWHSFSTNSSEI